MSKLKNVDTSEREAFLQHLKDWNEMAKLTGNELSKEDQEKLVKLHCDEGLSIDEAIERILNE